MLEQLVHSPAQGAGTIGVQQKLKSKRVRAAAYVKRAFDLVVCILLLPLLSILIAAVAIAIKLTCKGPILYWSNRVGCNNRIFRMPKFRTMNTGTPEVATHLLRDPHVRLTPIGSFLRRTSLDELPQIYCILKGDLSLVGPRPALHNQDDLVRLRTKKGVHELVPGLTGWAQVNGRDDLPIPVKVEFDYQYLRERTFLFDLEIIGRTLIKVLTGDGIVH